MANDALKRQFAADLLGPVFFTFCHRLWLYHTAVRQSPARALFLARGGLRLLELYRRFLEIQNFTPPIACHPLMVSRLMATKAGLTLAPALAMVSLMREHRRSTLGELIGALSPSVGESLNDVYGTSPSLHAQCTELSFYQFLNSRHPSVAALQSHLEEQTLLLSEHLTEAAGDARQLVLCDTGLFASTQALLMACYPRFTWSGTYFGRANYRCESAPHHAHAFGLIVDLDRASTWAPESVFLRYWHLCEMPLEPNLPTVTHYVRDPTSGRVRSNLEQPDWEVAVTDGDNPFFAGVLDYFNSARPQSAESINTACASALQELHCRVCQPTLKDVAAMTVGCRSPDFGRTGSVPVVTLSKGRQSLAIKLRAVRKSLWREGQIRVSFSLAGGFLNAAWLSARRGLDLLSWVRHLR